MVDCDGDHFFDPDWVDDCAGRNFGPGAFYLYTFLMLVYVYGRIKTMGEPGGYTVGPGRTLLVQAMGWPAGGCCGDRGWLFAGSGCRAGYSLGLDPVIAVAWGGLGEAVADDRLFFFWYWFRCPGWPAGAVSWVCG